MDIFDTAISTLTESEVRELISKLQEEAGYLHCKRCGHNWLPRNYTEEPKVCPHCGSPYWNKEYQRADMIGEETC